jgi:CBS domain containing-hemolysin-like protein
MDPAIQILIIILCVIGSAFFSATETAFTTLNKIRIKNLAEKDDKRAKLVLRLSDNYDKLISTILVGNNIVNILASSLATLFFIGWLAASIGEAGSSTVSTVVVTVIVLTFGEITPKTVAKRAPEKFAMFAAPIINFFLIIFTPVTVIFRALQNFLAKIAKSDDDKGMTEEELISIIEEAEEEGGLGEDESTLIKSAIEFNELEVGDIFTPRIDITAVSIDTPHEKIEETFSMSGYSRIPVYEGDIDNVTGILYYKDFFSWEHKDGADISEIVKPAVYVPKAQKINDLLRDLQEKQLHMAIVMDEYGSTAGLVTLEDILEEIVGDIWDEHDEKIEEIKEEEDGSYTVSGRASISKLFDIFEIDKEIEPVTVNGWALDVLGKLPREGEIFEDSGLRAEILKANAKCVEELRITDVRESENEEDDEKNDKKSKEKDDE